MGRDKYNLNVPEIHRMYERGWSLQKLGKLLRVEPKVIVNRFRRFGLPMRTYHHKLEADILEVYEKYQQGMSFRALSKVYGVSAAALADRFAREGLPTERYHRKVPLETLAQLHKRGLSQPQMAKKLGVSRTAVFRAMERLRAFAPQFASIKRVSRRWHEGSVMWPPQQTFVHIECPALRGLRAGLLLCRTR